MTTPAQVPASNPIRTVGGGPEGVYELAAPIGRPVMYQRWRELLFLHWEADPAEIAATLPEGLTVDTFKLAGEPGPGRAYVGIVPFEMGGVRPRGLPPVPGLSWFGELNLRTYVLGPDGRPGVWFYSLDAHQRIAVWLARRLFALPYHYAAIRSTREGKRVEYCWARGRKLNPQAMPSFAYRTPDPAEAAPAAPGTLEHFLVERYLLFSHRPLHIPSPGASAPSADGRVYAGQVDHPPYRIASANIDCIDATLFDLNGLAPPGDTPPVSVLWSPGVDVHVYPLHRVTISHE